MHKHCMGGGRRPGCRQHRKLNAQTDESTFCQPNRLMDKRMAGRVDDEGTAVVLECERAGVGGGLEGRPKRAVLSFR